MTFLKNLNKNTYNVISFSHHDKSSAKFSDGGTCQFPERISKIVFHSAEHVVLLTLLLLPLCENESIFSFQARVCHAKNYVHVPVSGWMVRNSGNCFGSEIFLKNGSSHSIFNTKDFSFTRLCPSQCKTEYYRI